MRCDKRSTDFVEPFVLGFQVEDALPYGGPLPVSFKITDVKFLKVVSPLKDNRKNCWQLRENRIHYSGCDRVVDYSG